MSSTGATIGKVDYMWLVWDLQAPKLAHAPTIWIPPRPKVKIQFELAIAA